MYTDILINATSYENRVALVKNGDLLEYHVERLSEKGLIGNIYLGKVVRVLPGIDAAFVDIGLSRTGFLYVDDVVSPGYEQGKEVFGRQAETSEKGEDAALAQVQSSTIEQMLYEGQKILVQIAKEPIGTKGARLTCSITLPCRNLVFMPLTDHIGVSRKIEDEETRQQLREKIEMLRPQGTGFIMRTVAEHISDSALEADMEFLLLLWDDILSKAKTAPAPSLLYKDIDIILRSVRDFFTESINELVIDSQDMYDQLIEFAKTFAPQLQERIIYYDQEKPLFEEYDIEDDINRALDKKVWLRSGGYLIFETTEALTVIDVNTGRFVGRNHLSETIFRTNMEAVKEIAAQLRLRNIGGIIIIDFIDMETEDDREHLYQTLQRAVQEDKSKINILRPTEFGLVQMTRKRQTESLTNIICEPCHYCGGDGYIRSKRTVCYDIFRKISRDAKKIGGSNVTIKVHPQIAEMLLTEEIRHIEQLEKETAKRFTIIPVPDLHMRRYDIIWKE